MKRNTAIDIGRFFASLMVVCLHTKFPVKLLGPFVADIAKFSVPFFLLTSGFYLYDVENEKFKAKVKKSIKKSRKNGHGKAENELEFLELYLSQVFKKNKTKETI